MYVLQYFLITFYLYIMKKNNPAQSDNVIVELREIDLILSFHLCRHSGPCGSS